MKIRTISIPVLDQAEALAFYTDKLNFVTKNDIPVGGGNRWLTVVSKDDINGPELLLEPAPKHFEPSKVYQTALFEAGIPCTQFNVEDTQAEYERLLKLDVEFKMQPTDVGSAKIAILNDTCGNLIQLVEVYKTK